MKIYVIGSTEFVQGFRIVGLKDIYEVKSRGEFVNALKEVLEKKDAGMVIVDDVFFKQIPLFLKKELEQIVVPVIIGFDINAKYLDESLIKDLIKRSLGVDVEL